MDIALGIVMLAAAIACLVVVVPIASGRGEPGAAMAAFLAVTVALAAIGISLLLPARAGGRRGPRIGVLLAALLGVIGGACLVDPIALTASEGSRGPQTPIATVVFGVLLLGGAIVSIALLLRGDRRARDE